MSDPASRRGAGRAGVREVAALAGVSTQTVSRVTNGHAGIRPDTRRRVLEAITQLGYRVNNAARALGTATSRTLGVIASDATLYGPSAGIAAIEASARAQGRWVATAYADAGDEASVDEAFQHLLGQGVDGVILVAARTGSTEALRAREGVPVAVLHADATAGEADAATLPVAHLGALGHRRIARLGGPPDWLEELARAAGFARALRQHGIEPGPVWSGDWSAASGAAAADEAAAAVRAAGGPTAIVVANDQMALGLIAGLQAAGLSVPGDVSVAGFDDNPDAAYYRPALTTVRIDVAGEARRCVAEVLGLDATGAVTPPRLVVRASTAALPRD